MLSGAARGPAAGRAARLFRRPDAFGDRRGAGHAARDGQGPHATRDGEDAGQARGGRVSEHATTALRGRPRRLPARRADRATRRARSSATSRAAPAARSGRAGCGRRSRCCRPRSSSSSRRPQLRERLMETVRAEAAAAASGARGRRAAGHGRAAGWAARGPAPALALARCAGVAAGAVGLRARLRRRRQRDRHRRSRHRSPAARRDGVVERTGDQGILRVSGLPQRRGPHLRGVDRARQGGAPARLFQVHRDGTGAAAIPRGLEDADQVMVTLEPPAGARSPRAIRS